MSQGTAQRLAAELANMLRPLASRLSDQQVLDTFEQLGIRFPEEFLENPAISTARRTVVDVARALDSMLDDLSEAVENDDPVAMVAATLAIATRAGKVVEAYAELSAAISGAGPGLPGVTPEQVAELTTDLANKITSLLLADTLERSPLTGTVLAVFGIVERTLHAGVEDDPTRPPHERVTVRLDRLLPAISDPARHLADLYRWGRPDFDAERLFGVLELAVARLGIPVVFEPGDDSRPPRLQIFAVDLEPTADGRGVHLRILLPAELEATVPVAISPPTWTAEVTNSVDISAEATAELPRPLEVAFSAPGGTTAWSTTVSLRARAATPILAFGEAGGSRLEFERFDLTIGFELVTGTDGVARGEPVAIGQITGGRIVLDTSAGDSFLSTVLGGRRLESRFDLGFSFRPQTGLRFSGGGLNVQIPVHVQLGPIDMQSVYLAAALSGGSVGIELSAAFGVHLGPILASVDRLGVRAEFGFPPDGGNLGPAQLDFAFQPPRGVGLTLDLDVVKGGGFLLYDPDRGEYAGALELEFADFLAVKGIGLLSTRMPDGSRGFSLLIILTAQFPEPGLQLGLGFRLLAIGGLIGLNRTIAMQALMNGVRSGAIESVMFPRDVIANAPRILSDLRTFFPPQPGRFLIGPMAKIAWGSPAILTGSLAVIIEIPGNISFLGVLRVALPRTEAPILLLQVNFAGAIEPDQQRMYFTATLFESRILHLSIDGDLGVLVGWGNDANLILTVGGFHPSYTPPPLPFPTPRRVTIDILNERNARIGISGYFAITSNTVQFGADAEIYFKFSAFRVEGHLGIDALFQLSPFAFAAEVRAGVSLKAFGVGCFSIKLRFALEGPTPWRAHGRGSVSLFFFDISANFDVTWGESRDTTLPPIRVLPLLAAELSKPGNWQTRGPSVRPLVTLRDFSGTPEALVLHPMGTLFVRQLAVPLDLKLDRFGAQRPSDADRFSVEVTGGGLVKIGDVEELFAPAQFQDMDDAAKMSRPAFQRQHAGLELAPDGNTLASFRASRRTARYEEVIIDSARAPDRRPFATFPAGLFTHFLKGNSISRSELSQAQRRLMQPFTETLQVIGDRFTVAHSRDNTAASSSFASEAAASEFLAGRLAQNPGLTGTLHVIPSAEVRS